MAESKLVVRLVAENAKLHRELDRSNKKLRKFSSNAKKHAGLVTKALAGIGVAIVIRQFAMLAKSALAAGDALAKTASKLGISTEALAGLQRAAKITGVAQETLTKALTKQQKAIFDANRGLLTYKQHFDALGLSTEALMKLSPDQQFGEIAEALNKLENQTLKTAIAYDIFGGRGTALINTLAVGKTGLKAFADQAKFLGTAISKDTAKKMEDFNDAFDTLGDSILGATNILVANFGPVISKLINSLAFGLPIAILESSLAIREFQLMSAKAVSTLASLHLAMFKLTTIPLGESYKEELRTRQELLNHAKTEVDFIENRQLPALQKQLDAKNKLRDSFSFDPVSGAADLGNPAETILGTQEQWTETMAWQRDMVGQHMTALNQAQMPGEKASRAMAEISAKARVDIMSGMFANLISLTGGKSRKLFNAMKAGAIVTATIDGYLAVQKSLAAYPYPWNIAAGVAAGAATAVQIQSISSQSFKGQAHDGLDYVPTTGTYLLEKGERVVSKEDNKAGGETSVSINLSFLDVAQANEWTERNRAELSNMAVDAIRVAMNRQGMEAAF